MSWQSGSINPATTSPLADISRIKNDLSVLKGVLGGTQDADVPFTPYAWPAARIVGDFSNATLSNRVMFQTSVANGYTGVYSLPNGTNTEAQIGATNSSDANNAAYLDLAITGTEARVRSVAAGSGTYLPMTFYTGGAERLRIGTSGDVLVISASGGLGYGVGAGGTVTQSTSKSTAVTLNKPCGQITMNNAALGAGTAVFFQLNNSLISGADTVQVVTFGGGTSYLVNCVSVAAGAALIRVVNNTGGSLSDAVVINFAIIKGATS